MVSRAESSRRKAVTPEERLRAFTASETLLSPVDAFVVPSESVAEQCRQALVALLELLAKTRYGFSMAAADAGALEREQLWAILHLHARPALRGLRRRVGRLRKDGPDAILADVLRLCGDDVSDDGAGSSQDEDEAPRDEAGALGSSDDEPSDDHGTAGGTDSEEEDSDVAVEEKSNRRGEASDAPSGGSDGAVEDLARSDEDEVDEEERSDEEQSRADSGNGIREDRFFSLAEMDEFMEEGDRIWEELHGDGESHDRRSKGKRSTKRTGAGNSDESEQSEDDEDSASESGEDERDSEEDELAALQSGDDARDVTDLLYSADLEGEEPTKYGDYFAPGGSKRALAQPAYEEEWMEDPDVGSEDEEDEGAVFASAYAQQQQKLQEKIRDLEEENIGERKWTLHGEISAKQRPQDSLLEEHLDYDAGSKVAPEITQEITVDIEEMIRKRILDGNFDDVVRRVAPKSKQREEIELDSEKSKVGLAEVYEKDYLREVEGVDSKEEELSAEKRAIAAVFKQLCYKLDALSNFHFTPKPSIEEMSVKVSAPAIQMEEVMPIAASSEQTAAPEEVFAKPRHETKASSEMTTDERQAARRQKKAARRKARRAKDAERKAVAKANPSLGNKHAKSKIMDELNAATRRGEIKQGKTAKSSGMDYGNSTTVFGMLDREQASGGVAASNARKRASEREESRGSSSKKLKL